MSLIQNDWYLYTKNAIKRDVHRRLPPEQEDGDHRAGSVSQGTPNIASKPSESRK